MSSEVKIKTSITLPETLNALIEKFSQEFNISKSEIIESATSFVINLMCQKTLQDIVCELLKYIYNTVREFLNNVVETFTEVETECEKFKYKPCGYGIAISYKTIMFYKYWHEKTYTGELRKHIIRIVEIEPENNVINVDYEITLTHLRYIIQLMSKLFKLKP